MPKIRIGTKDHIGALRERLFFELDFLKEDGILIEIDEKRKGELIIFECNCTSLKEEVDERTLLNIFKEYIANSLSDLVINYFEEEFLFKILRDNYKGLTPNEEEGILEIAKNRLDLSIDIEEKEGVSRINRKNSILLEIVEYLDMENEIILEGFIRFRIKTYLAQLELALDAAVDEFVMEGEYEEFVNLLKYFIEDQDAKIRTINVIKFENESFQILDEEGNLVENTYLDKGVLNMVNCNLDYEDLLISALITTAPEEIILHFKGPTPLIRTLKKVFEDKISICLGCDYCRRSNLNDLE